MVPVIPNRRIAASAKAHLGEFVTLCRLGSFVVSHVRGDDVLVRKLGAGGLQRLNLVTPANAGAHRAATVALCQPWSPMVPRVRGDDLPVLGIMRGRPAACQCCHPRERGGPSRSN